MNLAGIISSSYNRHLRNRNSLKKLISQVSAHVSCNKFLSLPTQQFPILNCSSILPLLPQLCVESSFEDQTKHTL